VMERQVPSVRLDGAAGGIAPFRVALTGLCYSLTTAPKRQRAGRLFSMERTVRGVPTPLLLSMHALPCDGPPVMGSVLSSSNRAVPVAVSNR
jgi:hypothetical protein